MPEEAPKKLCHYLAPLQEVMSLPRAIVCMLTLHLLQHCARRSSQEVMSLPRAIVCMLTLHLLQHCARRSPQEGVCLQEQEGSQRGLQGSSQGEGEDKYGRDSLLNSVRL